jgi:hypothetical protein
MTAKIISQKEYKDNFLKKVLKLPSGCWIWMGAVQGKYYKSENGGYGSVGFNGKVTTAHRVSCMIHGKDIPGDLHVDHLCRVTLCVNPDHLEFVTSAENHRRGINNKGEYQKAKTHCKNGHEYDVKNTKILKDYKTGRTYRACKICRSETYKKHDIKRGRIK